MRKKISSKDKKKVLDVYALIQETDQKITKVVRQQFKNVDPKESFFIYSRLLNLMFGRHYRITLNKCEEGLQEEHSRVNQK